MENQKKKLRLEDIKVESFVTVESTDVTGGTASVILCSVIILGSCMFPCTGAVGDGGCTTDCQPVSDVVAIAC